MNRTLVLIRKLIRTDKSNVAIAGRRIVAVVECAFAILFTLSRKCGLSLENFVRGRSADCVPADADALG